MNKIKYDKYVEKLKDNKDVAINYFKSILNKEDYSTTENLEYAAYLKASNSDFEEKLNTEIDNCITYLKAEADTVSRDRSLSEIEIKDIANLAVYEDENSLSSFLSTTYQDSVYLDYLYDKLNNFYQLCIAYLTT